MGNLIERRPMPKPRSHPCHPSWHARIAFFGCDDRPGPRTLTPAADPTPTSGVIAEDSMRLTYDATTDVAYLTFRATGPADVLGPTLLLEHDRDFAGAVALDFGLLDGRVVGLEFQAASACLPAKLLAAAERIDGQHLARITEMRLGRRVQSSRAGRPTRVQ
jgi:uncharacterized protein YuzE